jgi:hypothetical protein
LLGPETVLSQIMVLLDDIVEIFHLADHDGGTVFLVVATDGRRIGLTAVDSDLCRHAMPADRQGDCKREIPGGVRAAS